MNPLYLLVLGLVPIAAHIWAHRKCSKFKWSITGAAIGLVISSFSMGLYATYFLGPHSILGPLALHTGMLGLMLGMIHSDPGYQLALLIGLVPARTVVEGVAHLYVQALTGLLWAILYGALGWLLDRFRKSRVAL